MPGVNVRDVDVSVQHVFIEIEQPVANQLQAHKFIEAYAAFLKRQGKLPIPG